MKYFNLEFGETILVAPQKDGSIRFLQVDLPNASTNSIDGHVSDLAQRGDVISFFSADSNI